MRAVLKMEGADAAAAAGDSGTGDAEAAVVAGHDHAVDTECKVCSGAVGADGAEGGAVEMMYEYAVDMVCEKCSDAVHKALDGMANVTSVTTNVQNQLVIVEGSFAPAVIVETLTKIGRKVRLIGSGCGTAVEKGVFVVPASVGRSGENSAGALQSIPRRYVLGL